MNRINYRHLCKNDALNQSVCSLKGWPTSVVPHGEVAAVGPLRSQAEEELVSQRRLVCIDCTHSLDPLSETPAQQSSTQHELHEFEQLQSISVCSGFQVEQEAVKLRNKMKNISSANKPNKIHFILSLRSLEVFNM